MLSIVSQQRVVDGDLSQGQVGDMRLLQGTLRCVFGRGTIWDINSMP